MNLTRRRVLAVLVVLVTAADWLSKFWIQNRMYLGEVRPVVDGWVFLAHRRNTGVAFSMFAGAPSYWRIVALTLAGVVGMSVCARLIASTRDAVLRFAATLVLAGALGNLGDRVLNGGVTDFILVRFFPFVFNVADVAITVGGILLVARLVLGEERTEAEAPAAV